jgi:hypothetical protein
LINRHVRIMFAGMYMQAVIIIMLPTFGLPRKSSLALSTQNRDTIVQGEVCILRYVPEFYVVSLALPGSSLR